MMAERETVRERERERVGERERRLAKERELARERERVSERKRERERVRERVCQRNSCRRFAFRTFLNDVSFISRISLVSSHLQINKIF